MKMIPLLIGLGEQYLLVVDQFKSVLCGP